MAMLNSSVGSADLWQEGSAFGGVLQAFGQQHFAVCSGQLLPSAVAFKLALSNRLKSVVLKPNATNTTAATTILRIPCMIHMLDPEAERSKTILCFDVARSVFRGSSLCCAGSLMIGLLRLRLVTGTLDDRKAWVFREVRITG